MGLEIEHKFLVRDDSYKTLATSRSRIVQGYICSERGRTVRVRLRAELPMENTTAAGTSGKNATATAAGTSLTSGKGYLTIKGPSMQGGLSRYEFEKEITLDEAFSLLRLCEPGTIDKVRWLVPTSDGHTFEVDEFFGDNEGLTVAEVELSHEAETFERPDFLAEDVTGDRRYYNSQLRQRPYKTW